MRPQSEIQPWILCHPCLGIDQSSRISAAQHLKKTNQLDNQTATKSRFTVELFYHRMGRRIHIWDDTVDRPPGFWHCHSDVDLCSCWSTTRAPIFCDICTRWGQSCWTGASAVRNSPLSFVRCTKTWPETGPAVLLFRSCQARSWPNRSSTSERSPCFTTIIERFVRFPKKL